MPSDSWSDEVAGLLKEIEAQRDDLLRRRRESPYPWDTGPIDEYNRLLDRARAALPAIAAKLPGIPATVPSGMRLWRTPTDDALDAIENLRAALITGYEQPRGTERH
jgi:hypothetical protein